MTTQAKQTLGHIMEKPLGLYSSYVISKSNQYIEARITPCLLLDGRYMVEFYDNYSESFLVGGSEFNCKAQADSYARKILKTLWALDSKHNFT